AGGVLGKFLPWVGLAVSSASLISDGIDLYKGITGKGSDPGGGGPLVDRPAMDANAGVVGRSIARGAGLGDQAAGAPARTEFGGRIRIELPNMPRGARVTADQEGPVGLDVHAGYNLGGGPL